MDIKIFLMTFGIVFLAELGDKTQLTALALTSGNKGAALSVFFGSAIALACTSGIAVFGGEFITKWIPERWLNIGSAALFIIMGLIYLFLELRQNNPA